MFKRLFSQQQTEAPSEISPAALQQHLTQGEQLYILDVRSAEEYAVDGHIAGAHLIPLPELSQRSVELPHDQTIICVCRSGNRSGVACSQLASRGFAPVVNMAGGMLAWNRAGLPAKQGQEAKQ